MGTKSTGALVSRIPNENPPVPPGFVSMKSFTIEKCQDDDASTITGNPAHSPDPVCSNMEYECSSQNEMEVKKRLRHRPWMNYGQFSNIPDEESDTELSEHDEVPIYNLGKGVIRGCLDCPNCQKVVARWHPEQARRPVLDEAPVFHPTQEEFRDTIKYIAALRPLVEPYGICKIIPPKSWKPPCPPNEKVCQKNFKFSTRIQPVHKLQNRFSTRQMETFHRTMKKKRQRVASPDEARHLGDSEHLVKSNDLDYHDCAEKFGFESGPDFTFEDFKEYADHFKKQYFSAEVGNSNPHLQGQWEPSVEGIEGEYWRIVEKPTEEIEVLYGADVEIKNSCSGLPRASSGSISYESEEEYVASGWNLNNFPRLPGSVLSFESGNIPGVLVPWLYVGMCFSSFCWHVEDHHLYSMNYMHFGAPKLWYGVPGRHALKLEMVMKKHLSHLFHEQPDLLDNLVTQFSPSILKSEGVPVYRCVQYPGEFVLTFPRAYHSGFNCGFNCAEAVNVAPIDWLPHGQNAVELYRDRCRKISISHDKLLLGAAREAVKSQWNGLLLRHVTSDFLLWRDFCGQDKLLAKTLKARVLLERLRRDMLCSSQSKKMGTEYDSKTERECFICHYDLYLSAASCSCSLDKFACLDHVADLCSCDLHKRSFLFRYDNSELNTLVDAVGGKLSAIHRWGVSDLQLSLSSTRNKEKTYKQDPIESSSLEVKPVNKVSEGVLSGLPTLVEKICQKATEQSPDVPPYKKRVVDPISHSGTPGNACTLLSGENKLESAPNRSSCNEEGSMLAMKVTSHGNSNIIGTVLFEAKHEVAPTPINKPSVIQTLNNRSGNGSITNSSKELMPSCSNGGHENNIVNNGNMSMDSKLPVCLKDDDESQAKKAPLPASNLINKGQQITKCVPYPKDTIGGTCSQQKGPQVSRINYTVEPLDYGIVLPGKEWCSKTAIFPKGYKSRVKYFSIKNPTETCYYISEILDVGRRQPFFMVQLEQCPDEMFIHASVTKCWDMVRQSLNIAIRKLHSRGKFNVTLQPPGSVDGFVMFGFSTPEIVQAIEAKDCDHICLEYWSSRTGSSSKDVEVNEQSIIEDKFLPSDHHTILKVLFMKASTEELQVLRSILTSDVSSSKQEAIQRLKNEMKKRRS